MKRQVLRWIGLALFVALLCAVMIRLGEWQIHRLQGRREANAIIRTHRTVQAVGWATIFRPGERLPADAMWRQVRVSGTFDVSGQVQVRYRNVGDEQGSEVLTPLRTDDGRTVLIDRGFMHRLDDGADADVSDIPAPPSGRVTITGYAKGNENGKNSAVVPVDGRARLINSESFARAHGTRYVDGYIVLLSSSPEQSPDLKPIPYPELNDGPHLSYAIQWFIFTAIAIGGLFILIRGDIRDRRKGRRRTFSASGPPPTHKKKQPPVGKPPTRGGVPIGAGKPATHGGVPIEPSDRQGSE